MWLFAAPDGGAGRGGNMDYNLLARTAKAVALFGFFLPWVLVSCSGTEIASATGWQLMTGHVELQGPLANQPPPDAADPAIFVILAFAAAVLGLLASLALRQRAAAMALLIFGLAGAGFTGLSMQQLHSAVQREAEGVSRGDRRPVSDNGEELSERAERQITRAVAGMVRLKEQPGYWTTLLALIAASGLALVSLSAPAQQNKSDPP
jgi:hypothetical protein